MTRLFRSFGLAAPVLFIVLVATAARADPLPSWNEGPTKAAIVDFVESVTTFGDPDYVPPKDRIATFDNDGTLWVEQPIYTQFAFALDRVKALAPQHPEWKTEQPFAAVLADDVKGMLANGEKGMMQIMAVTHSGMTTEAFAQIAAEWFATARHPRFDRPYTDLTYQPMLELLSYLRDKDFKTFIVSGGGIEFMRVVTDEIYGVPTEQVVGSAAVTKFEDGADGDPEILREPKVLFIDDGAGKPEGINLFIGRRPILAFGNSDGDLEMLEWTTAGEGARFAAIVHHTDAVREYAYDRESEIGRLDKALDAARPEGWTVVDMAKDWKTVFGD